MLFNSRAAPSPMEAAQVDASTPKNRADRRIALVAAGFAAGVCIVLTAAGLHTVQRGRHMAATLAAPSTATPTVRPPAPTRTRAPTQTPIPTALASLLQRAEKYLDVGEPQGAIDLLSPLVDQSGDPEDLAHANELLAQAETMFGRYQRAAAYFQAAFDLAPTVTRLFLLATSYDAGGDLERALAAYLRVLNWSDGTADEYRSYSEQRVEALIDVLGTPTPSATPW